MGKNSIKGHGHNPYTQRNNGRVQTETLAQRQKANAAARAAQQPSVAVVDNTRVATPQLSVHEKINARAQAPSQFGGKSVWIENQQRYVSWSPEKVQAHAGAVNQPPAVNYNAMNAEQKAYYESLKGKPSAQLTSAEKKWLRDVKKMGREVDAATKAEQQAASKAAKKAAKKAKANAKKLAAAERKAANRLLEAERQAAAEANRVVANQQSAETIQKTGKGFAKFFQNPQVKKALKAGATIAAIGLAVGIVKTVIDNKKDNTTTPQTDNSTDYTATPTVPTDSATTVVETPETVENNDSTTTPINVVTTPDEQTPVVSETDEDEFAVGTKFPLENGKYNVVKGDNLWNMSKAYLTDKNGKVPTDTEILTQVYLLMKKNPELKWEDDNSGVVLIYPEQKINFEA